MRVQPRRHCVGALVFRVLGNEPNMEEERRLFYVALTRAERRLHLSWCSSRRRMGKPSESLPSPFLEEIPPECVEAHGGDEDFSPDFAAAWKKISGE